jgi:integrase
MFRLAVELAFYFGLRCGEVAILQARDFDLEEGVLWAKTLKRIHRHGLCKRCGERPKRICEIQRHKIIPYDAVPLKKPWERTGQEIPTYRLTVPKGRAEKVVVEAVKRAGSPNGWVFPMPTDRTRPRDTQWFRWRFRVARDKAGIKRLVSFHALRHAHGTLVAMQTKDPVFVRDRLRHTNVATTNRYMHAAKDYAAELEKGLKL